MRRSKDSQAGELPYDSLLRGLEEAKRDTLTSSSKSSFFQTRTSRATGESKSVRKIEKFLN